MRIQREGILQRGKLLSDFVKTDIELDAEQLKKDLILLECKVNNNLNLLDTSTDPHPNKNRELSPNGADSMRAQYNNAREDAHDHKRRANLTMAQLHETFTLYAAQQKKLAGCQRKLEMSSAWASKQEEAYKALQVSNHVQRRRGAGQLLALEA